jgi:hypothetical protein
MCGKMFCSLMYSFRKVAVPCVAASRMIDVTDLFYVYNFRGFGSDDVF